jgi:hypothetical protein
MFLTAAPSQVPGPQTAPAMWLRQAPLPSHIPSSPQLETSEAGQVLATRGGLPTGMNPHRPGELGVLQDLQVSVQALLQQTLSTQKPLAQSPAQPQAIPLPLCMAFVLLQVTAGPSAARSMPPSPGGLLPWLWQPTTIAAARTTVANQVRTAWRRFESSAMPALRPNGT